MPDPLLAGLLSAAPEMAVASVLGVLLFGVWRYARADRTSYEAGLAAAQTRYAADLERLTKAHDAEWVRVTKAHDDELGELRVEIRQLRQQVDELNRKLDDERAARRAAQDDAWRRLQGGDPA